MRVMLDEERRLTRPLRSCKLVAEKGAVSFGLPDAMGMPLSYRLADYVEPLSFPSPPQHYRQHPGEQCLCKRLGAQDQHREGVAVGGQAEKWKTR